MLQIAIFANLYIGWGMHPLIGIGFNKLTANKTWYFYILHLCNVARVVDIGVLIVSAWSTVPAEFETFGTYISKHL